MASAFHIEQDADERDGSYTGGFDQGASNAEVVVGVEPTTEVRRENEVVELNTQERVPDVSRSSKQHIVSFSMFSQIADDIDGSPDGLYMRFKYAKYAVPSTGQNLLVCKPCKIAIFPSSVKTLRKHTHFGGQLATRKTYNALLNLCHKDKICCERKTFLDLQAEPGSRLDEFEHLNDPVASWECDLCERAFVGLPTWKRHRDKYGCRAKSPRWVARGIQSFVPHVTAWFKVKQSDNSDDEVGSLLRALNESVAAKMEGLGSDQRPLQYLEVPPHIKYLLWYERLGPYLQDVSSRKRVFQLKEALNPESLEERYMTRIHPAISAYMERSRVWDRQRDNITLKDMIQDFSK